MATHDYTTSTMIRNAAGLGDVKAVEAGHIKITRERPDNLDAYKQRVQAAFSFAVVVEVKVTRTLRPEWRGATPDNVVTHVRAVAE